MKARSCPLFVLLILTLRYAKVISLATSIEPGHPVKLYIRAVWLGSVLMAPQLQVYLHIPKNDNEQFQKVKLDYSI